MKCNVEDLYLTEGGTYNMVIETDANETQYSLRVVYIFSQLYSSNYLWVEVVT